MAYYILLLSIMRAMFFHCVPHTWLSVKLQINFFRHTIQIKIRINTETFNLEWKRTCSFVEWGYAYCEMIMHSFICLNNCRTILCIRVLYYSLHICFWYILIRSAIASKKNISCILVKTNWKMLNFEIEIKQFKTNRQTSIFILTLAVWIIPHV